MAQGRVLVVGSINVDLYHKMSPSHIQLDAQRVDVSPIKGMTLPAKSFVEHPGIAAQGVKSAPGDEETVVMTMRGPFEQKTGGKGANAAAAAGQTLACELFCHFGESSADANRYLLADLKKYGNVDTSRSSTVPGPTGTAYILLFEDRDNAIVLLAGGNGRWDQSNPVSPELNQAIQQSKAVMLQREIPDFVNAAVAKAARACGTPVIMDMGGTDAPLDPALIPYLSVIAPNESELTFISGVETSVGGEVSLGLVREAVAALKKRCEAAGNPGVEVLVTLGKEGSIHFGRNWSASGSSSGREETTMGRFELTSPKGMPRDTTGAGDCYRGSYVAAHYGLGKSVPDAMQWAAAAAALSVEVEGAMPSMPTRKAIEAALKAREFDGFSLGRERRAPGLLGRLAACLPCF